MTTINPIVVPREAMVTLIMKATTGGQFFTVHFRKKDGTLRKMTCRRGVTSRLKGGKLNWNPANFNMVTVFDTVKGGYRTINANTATYLATDKKTFVVEE